MNGIGDDSPDLAVSCFREFKGFKFIAFRLQVYFAFFLLKSLDGKITVNHRDLPPKHVPDFKLELCHFLFLNANMPLALGDGNSMNYVV